MESIFEAAKQLLVSKTDAGQRPVRLIGVSGTNLVATQEAVDTNRSATRLNGDTDLVEGQTVNGWKSLF